MYIDSIEIVFALIFFRFVFGHIEVLRCMKMIETTSLSTQFQAQINFNQTKDNESKINRF